MPVAVTFALLVIVGVVHRHDGFGLFILTSMVAIAVVALLVLVIASL